MAQVGVFSFVAPEPSVGDEVGGQEEEDDREA